MPKKISNAYTDLASGVLKVKNGKSQQEKMKDAAKIWNDINAAPKPKPKKNNTQLSFQQINSLKYNNAHYILNPHLKRGSC